MTRRLLLAIVALCAAMVVFAGPAAAHNTLLDSSPADGMTVMSLPKELTLRFDKSVPLDTVSLELIDPGGIRSTLADVRHGSAGDTEVIGALPSLANGPATIRWRLVGPDGHPLTGRVAFIVAADTISPVVTTPAESAPELSRPGEVAAADGFTEPWSVPASVRWLLRFVAYLAIMTIAGLMAAAVLVWPPAATHAVTRRAIGWAIGVIAVSAVGQLTVIGSDIQGIVPWRAWSGTAAAFDTDAGQALVIRLGLLVALAWVLLAADLLVWTTRAAVAGGLILGILATWAFAGHSRSMRWAVVGVPIDVAHHAAAAIWIGGLAVIGLVAFRDSSIDEIVAAVHRFSRVAAITVSVVVVTGVIQALRLVGNPTNLFDADHGGYLVMKLVVLAGMLKVADVNRRRVNRRFQSGGGVAAVAVRNLRRAMVTELGVGIVVVAITSMLVVSPPAVADTSAKSVNAAPAVTSVPAPTASSSVPALPEPASGGALDGDAGATTVVVSVACVISGALLRRGESGDDVGCLQEALGAAGFTEVSPTGTFDDATEAAVRSMQSSSDLDVDGVVGPATAAALGISPLG